MSNIEPDKTHSLYFSQYCYFCQKVLMALRGRDHVIQMKDVSSGLNNRELINGGGKGQVPCLRIEAVERQDTWMYESNDILAYINQHGLITK